MSKMIHKPPGTKFMSKMIHKPPGPKLFRYNIQSYTKKKIIDGFVQKPIGLHDFIQEVDTQLQAYEMQKKFPYP